MYTLLHARLRSTLVIVVLIVVCGLPAGCQLWPLDPEAGPSDGLVVRSGTSFGECLGYCRTELELTDSMQVFTQSGWDSVAYPVLRQERPMSTAQWQQIVRAVDFGRIEAMQDVYGCPDCADGGAEWIEVVVSGRQKRVTFEYGDTLQPIAPLLEEVRDLRSQFDVQDQP